MKLLKKIFYISLAISSIGFLGLFINQTYQKQMTKKNLENYYLLELEKLYTDGYAIDENSQLIWSQYKFESAIKEMEEKMLSEGFNSDQINRMKNEGRIKGQETRRIRDKFRNEARYEKKLD